MVVGGSVVVVVGAGVVVVVGGVVVVVGSGVVVVGQSISSRKVVVLESLGSMRPRHSLLPSHLTAHLPLISQNITSSPLHISVVGPGVVVVTPQLGKSGMGLQSHWPW